VVFGVGPNVLPAGEELPHWAILEFAGHVEFDIEMVSTAL
jgi:hypothetical protein